MPLSDIWLFINLAFLLDIFPQVIHDLVIVIHLVVKNILVKFEDTQRNSNIILSAQLVGLIPYYHQKHFKEDSITLREDRHKKMKILH